MVLFSFPYLLSLIPLFIFALFLFEGLFEVYQAF